MKNAKEEGDGLLWIVFVSAIILAALVAVAIAGCTSEPGCSLFGPPNEWHSEGDSYSECIRKADGFPTNIRLDTAPSDEVWVEWWKGGSRGFPRVAFNRKEWLLWTGKKVDVGSGENALVGIEPRALWVEYDFHDFMPVEYR